jgi:hypothetical protein
MPSPIAPARHARSTILIGSIASVRTAGRFDEYAARLLPADREVLVGAVAGSWIPIDVAFAHYQACDTLGFPVDQQVANGRATFDKTRGTLLGTLVRRAKAGGMTPWSVFPYWQRFWERGYDGGGVRVTKVGHKEVRVELVSFRLADSRYFRNALRGLVTGLTELFAAKAYATERPGPRAAGSTTLRLQWA